jgi:hypothetical protein
MDRQMPPDPARQAPRESQPIPLDHEVKIERRSSQKKITHKSTGGEHPKPHPVSHPPRLAEEINQLRGKLALHLRQEGDGAAHDSGSARIKLRPSRPAKPGHRALG